MHRLVFLGALVCALLASGAYAQDRPMHHYAVWAVSGSKRILSDGAIKYGHALERFAQVCDGHERGCVPVKASVFESQDWWYCLGYAWVDATEDLPARHHEARGIGNTQKEAVADTKRAAEKWHKVKWWVEEPRCVHYRGPYAD